jgi:hypothetical protein
MKLGDRIVIAHRLKRITRTEKTEDWPFQKIIREWVIVPTSNKEVMVVGKRTLCNGIVLDEDSVRFLNPKEYFDAFLVVDSLNRKPFLFDTRQGFNYLKGETETLDL